MHFSFSYNKKKVMQGLRYHFIARPEFKALIIVVNLFAIFAAVLLAFKKISAEPFLLSSALWLMLMLSIWYIVPYAVYKRSPTLKESYTAFFYEKHLRLQNEKGYVEWDWTQFNNYFESPHFFHLYFLSGSFFLIPKEGMGRDLEREVRELLGSKIEKKKK